MKENTIYTAITFAPVQGFIEKSRKLRDLYGSSFLLSYLARIICQAAENQGCQVISPAQINVTQGTPNQIIIQGSLPEKEAQKAFARGWSTITHLCKTYIEEIPDFTYHWQRAWNAWANHTWEFFWSQYDGNEPNPVTQVRKQLNEIKRERNWIGINWQGESSTLSGADGIAWYGMTDESHPLSYRPSEIDEKINFFYEKLTQKLGEKILDSNERLSIPELIKRVITTEKIVKQLRELNTENPQLFPDVGDLKGFIEINRHEQNQYTGWFQGDGDEIGKFLQAQSARDEENILKTFSEKMMNWGKKFPYYLYPWENQTLPNFEDRLPPLTYRDGRIIYAGGDDFLGVLFRNDPKNPLTAKECLEWFFQFEQIWQTHKQGITVSIGFVWAAPNVPQRDVLQHCRETEKLAKNNGRDRLAIRILFNSGNHLDWHCP